MNHSLYNHVQFILQTWIIISKQNVGQSSKWCCFGFFLSLHITGTVSHEAGMSATLCREEKKRPSVYFLRLLEALDSLLVELVLIATIAGILPLCVWQVLLTFAFTQATRSSFGVLLMLFAPFLVWLRQIIPTNYTTFSISIRCLNLICFRPVSSSSWQEMLVASMTEYWVWNQKAEAGVLMWHLRRRSVGVAGRRGAPGETRPSLRAPSGSLPPSRRTWPQSSSSRPPESSSTSIRAAQCSRCAPRWQAATGNIVNTSRGETF